MVWTFEQKDKLKGLDREDARERPGRMMVRITWKV